MAVTPGSSAASRWAMAHVSSVLALSAMVTPRRERETRVEVAAQAPHAARQVCLLVVDGDDDVDAWRCHARSITGPVFQKGYARSGVAGAWTELAGAADEHEPSESVD